MSTQLQAPGDELALRILTSVSYQQRLLAGRLTARMGIIRGSVRGLPELHLYLTPDDKALPAVNLERLADWIERVIADVELAREVRRVEAGASSYVNACQSVYGLVGKRVAQARQVLGADADTGMVARETRA
jgi:hypothetical protein